MTEPAPWMQTFTGKAVDLLDPKPEQIDLDDIAIALERMPRFNGHTIGRTWTVARHSHLVANLLPRVTADADPSLRLAALLHDAEETYIGDPIAPLKVAFIRLIGFDPYKAMKAPLTAAIHLRFGLPAELPEAWKASIRQADLMALHIEQKLFMAHPPRPWQDLPPVPDDAAAQVKAIDLYHDGLGSFRQLVEAARGES